MDLPHHPVRPSGQTGIQKNMVRIKTPSDGTCCEFSIHLFNDSLSDIDTQLSPWAQATQRIVLGAWQ